MTTAWSLCESALVYLWSGTRRGREAAAVEQYRVISDDLARMQAEGTTRDFAWYLAGQAGPHLLVVRGETEALTAMTAAPEAPASNMKSALINEGFQWGIYATGEGVDAVMGLFAQTVDQ